MTNSFMMQQTLEWLTANCDEIVTLFVREAYPTDPAHYQRMTSDQRRTGPEMVMTHVIARLEGKLFPAEAARAHYVERLQRGAQLTDLIARADLLQTIIQRKAEHDLHNTYLAEFATNRTAYAISLLKSAMIDALVVSQAAPR